MTNRIGRTLNISSILLTIVMNIVEIRSSLSLKISITPNLKRLSFSLRKLKSLKPTVTISLMLEIFYPSKKF